MERWLPIGTVEDDGRGAACLQFVSVWESVIIAPGMMPIGRGRVKAESDESGEDSLAGSRIRKMAANKENGEGPGAASPLFLKLGDDYFRRRAMKIAAPPMTIMA